MTKLDILEKSPLQQMETAFDSKLALQYFVSRPALNGRMGKFTFPVSGVLE
ncbi:hypothetical protein MM300_12945 [Evansella sp. LMS18]|uniref:hypothetical protein n=1 Tax=Evansella sp. LMS18 TaxID=2924033 RepID=UPI0020D18E94|nr:hypothetical protein [Evansella sp. LMS18]UTR08845.1 hypothetical protein MM300_12945 [Evansella sp. LMS18]